jgi:hypothetical protein
MELRVDVRRQRLILAAAGAVVLSISGWLAWAILLPRLSLAVAVERQGGVVTTEGEVPHWLFNLTAGRVGTPTKVTAVRLPGATIDLYLWKMICNLPELEMLDLSGSDLGDEHLATALPSANGIAMSLKRTKVTDAGLRHLCTARQIQHLDLNETSVGDGDLAALSAMTQLYTLGAERSLISDESLTSIGKLFGLHLLFLRGTRISGKTLPALRRCDQLISLDLSETQLQDENVAQLQTLPGLRLLEIDATPLTDRCVPGLKQLKQLRRLSLRDVRLSQRARAELRTALPQCQIEFAARRISGSP